MNMVQGLNQFEAPTILRTDCTTLSHVTWNFVPYATWSFDYCLTSIPFCKVPGFITEAVSSIHSKWSSSSSEREDWRCTCYIHTYVGKCIVYLQDKGTLLRPIVEGNLFTSIETLPISLSARRGSAPTLTMRETEIQLWSAHPRYYCRNLKKSRRRTFGRKKLQSLRRRPTG